MAALAVFGLVALAIRRGMPAGWFALPAAFCICGTLTILHPNQQLRFLHTWAPLLWILAGIGIALLLALVARLVGVQFARGIGVAAVACLALAQVQTSPGMARVGPGLGRGYDPADVSVRDLHDAYLPLIDGSKPTAVFCNLPGASWRWPFMERFGHKNDLQHNLRSVGVYDPATEEGAAEWIAATDSETVVYIEVPDSSPLFEPHYQPIDNSAILSAMNKQQQFQLVHHIVVRDLGTVWIWRR
jgi:hypothetical protein